MRARRPGLLVVVLLAILGLPGIARAAHGVTIPVRGVLDGETARTVVDRIRAARKDGVALALLDIDVDGAPDTGLTLVDEIETLRKSIRIAVLVSGRAPGSAAAVALAAEHTYITAAARIGPIPERGTITETVLRLFQRRDLSLSRISVLFPRSGARAGVDASAAVSMGMADQVVADRTQVYSLLGVEPAPIQEPTQPERVGRKRITGTFKHPYLIPFTGEIDDTLGESVKRRVEAAKKGGADLIIFEMDSPGGLVSASMDIGDLIFQTKIPTLMLILKEAYSGAALVSLAGDEIVMSPNGVIGDCQPIFMQGGGIEVAPEKIQTVLRATFRKYAAKSGYPIVLAQSMVTQQMVVDRVTFDDGTVEYLTPDDIAEAEKLHGPARETKEVVKKDQLLTMHAKEAQEFGFTGELVQNRAEALARFHLKESDLTILDETWAEHLSRFLLSIKFLLFLGGIIAAWMEIKAPGFGLPGAIAIVCFGLFFTASAISGISTGVEVVLFLVGIVLIGLEVFVIPGFGVPGIAGFLLVVASLYMASAKYGLPSPDRPWEINGFLNWLLYFGSTMIVALIGMLLVAKTLPKTPIGRKLILSPAGPVGSLGLTGSASVEGEKLQGLVGQRGRALSKLRPAGRIEVDDEPYNALSQGDWIDAGEEVEVIEVKGNRILVRQV